MAPPGNTEYTTRPPASGAHRVRARSLLGILGAMAVYASGASAQACATGTSQELTSELAARLGDLRSSRGPRVGEEPLGSAMALRDFYQHRGNAPAWIDGGAVSGCGRRLIALLRSAGDDGLDPTEYHLGTLEVLAESGVADPGGLIDLDLLLTDAFLTFGAHLLHGRADPASLGDGWLAGRRQLDMAAHLASTLEV